MVQTRHRDPQRELEVTDLQPLTVTRHEKCIGCCRDGSLCGPDDASVMLKTRRPFLRRKVNEMSQNKFPEEQAGPSEVPPETGFSRPIDQKRAARRRILGAALGAPLIYTLPVGAQGANTSQGCETENIFEGDEADLPGGEDWVEDPSGSNQWITQSCLTSLEGLSAEADSIKRIV